MCELNVIHVPLGMLSFRRSGLNTSLPCKHEIESERPFTAMSVAGSSSYIRQDAQISKCQNINKYFVQGRQIF